MRRKIFTYPSLAELRQHRKGVENAESFSTLVFMRLSLSPSVGMREMWGFVKDFQKIKMSKTLRHFKGRSASTDTVSLQGEDTESLPADPIPEPTISEDPHLFTLLLFIGNQFADIHERVRKCVTYSYLRYLGAEKFCSLFLWRRPVSSFCFGAVRTSLSLVGISVTVG